jgi:hypothetical protein
VSNCAISRIKSKSIAKEAIELCYNYSKQQGYDMERVLHAVQNTIIRMADEQGRGHEEIDPIMIELERAWWKAMRN